MPVIVRLNECPAAGIGTNLMPKGDGSFYLYLNTAMRDAAKLGVGDTAIIHLANDTEYRPGPAHPVPPAFETALESNRGARIAWQRLTPSRRKEILRYFAGLKSPVTLQRNIDKAVSVLAGRKARFMARDWN